MEALRAFRRSGIPRTLLLILLALSLAPVVLLGGVLLWQQVHIGRLVEQAARMVPDPALQATLQEIRSGVAVLGWAFLVICLLTVGGIVAAASFVSRNLARPLVLLGEVARQVSTGDYSEDVTRLIGPRRDEIGQFTEAFNLMVLKIEARETNLRAQVQRLKIEIDEARKARQVAEITDSDYFQELRRSAREMRQRRREQEGS